MIVEKSAVIPAQAQKVYDLLADYRVGHPAILPKEFTKLEVLEGGRGAGTKTRITMKSWGGKHGSCAKKCLSQNRGGCCWNVILTPIW